MSGCKTITIAFIILIWLLIVCGYLSVCFEYVCLLDEYELLHDCACAELLPITACK